MENYDGNKIVGYSIFTGYELGVFEYLRFAEYTSYSNHDRVLKIIDSLIEKGVIENVKIEEYKNDKSSSNLKVNYSVLNITADITEKGEFAYEMRDSLRIL